MKFLIYRRPGIAARAILYREIYRNEFEQITVFYLAENEWRSTVTTMWRINVGKLDSNYVSKFEAKTVEQAIEKSYVYIKMQE